MRDKFDHPVEQLAELLAQSIEPSGENYAISVKSANGRVFVVFDATPRDGVEVNLKGSPSPIDGNKSDWTLTGRYTGPASKIVSIGSPIVLAGG